MSYNDAENNMIDAAAYGPDDEWPDDNDTPDPAAERMAAHLDAVDAAEDWTPEPTDAQFAPSFDEWNATRQHTGKAPGTFTDYLADINDRDDAAGGRNPIVAMLARRWASESNGAGELPADWNMTAEVPF